jgi:hypothetical protein
MPAQEVVRRCAQVPSNLPDLRLAAFLLIIAGIVDTNRGAGA